MPDNFRLDTSVLDEIIKSIPEQLDRLGRAASEGITSDIKLSFNTSPPGKPRSMGSGLGFASQPGYPPNVDTGALRASMRWQEIGELEWAVMDGVEYGYGLEEGTSTIQPRPFVQPVFADWRKRKFLRLARNFGIVKGG